MSDVSALAAERRLKRLVEDTEDLKYRATLQTGEQLVGLIPGLCCLVQALAIEQADLLRALTRERQRRDA